MCLITISRASNISCTATTGSIRMGKIVAQAVAARLGKSLLELGGNNAIIVEPDAELKMVVPGTVFGAVGTCGQRCTSTRRLIIHSSIYDKVLDAITSAYGQLRIGDPLDQNNHVGPLIDHDAVSAYSKALEDVVEQGGRILVEGGVLQGPGYESGCYVKPAIAEANNDMAIVQHETFAPILYVMKYDTLDEAMAMQNGVVQGLSSAIMTTNLRFIDRAAVCRPRIHHLPHQRGRGSVLGEKRPGLGKGLSRICPRTLPLVQKEAVRTQLGGSLVKINQTASEKRYLHQNKRQFGSFWLV